MSITSTPPSGLFARIVQYLRRQTPAQTIVAVVVALAALKVAAPLLAPFLLALFLIAVFRPLQRRLQRTMANSLAIGLTIMAFLGCVSLFLAVLWVSSLSLLRKWPQYVQIFDHYLRLATAAGIPTPASHSDADLRSWLLNSSFSDEVVRAMAEGLAVFAAGFSLVIAYLIMGLLEVDVFDDKLHHILPGRADQHWVAVATKISAGCRRYMLVRTVIGLLSGFLVGGATWLIGLDFAIIWGVLAFLLKYIPTLGTLLTVLLPTLFALLQFGHWQRALIALLAVGAVQALQGIVINPLIQSKYLAPSPLVIVFSVVFWGWMWGVVGAFLAVPLTVFLIVTCRQFERTRWLATLLAHWEEDEVERG